MSENDSEGDCGEEVMTVESGVEVVADSEIVSLLDFRPVFRCEYSAHDRQHAGDEPAVVLLSVRCPGCGRDASFMMCGPGLARYVSGGIWCRRGCGEVFHGAEWVVRTVPVGGGFMSELTPALARAKAELMGGLPGLLPFIADAFAHTIVSAALHDPDDPDFGARNLYETEHASWLRSEDAPNWQWEILPEAERDVYRARYANLVAAILGEAS